MSLNGSISTWIGFELRVAYFYYIVDHYDLLGRPHQVI